MLALAEQEGRDRVMGYVQRVQSSVLAAPGAREFTVPEAIAEEVVRQLNSCGVPAYYVCEDCISAAGTYTKLYEFEEGR